MASSLPADQDRPLARLVPLRPADAAPIGINTPVARIGQGPQNEIIIDDDSVSTQHARLEYEGGTWRLTDLDSRNGSYLEGSRLTPGNAIPLADGAVIGIGAARLRFEQGAGVDVERVRSEYVAPTSAPRLAERGGFRLPVWVVIVVLLIGVIIGLYFSSQAQPPVAEPVVQPTVGSLLLPAPPGIAS